MAKLYPPGTNRLTFACMPQAVRADAVQEAFLADLQGRNPRRAARAYAERERCWRTRFRPLYP